MRLSGSVRRLAPSLCILATVSFPGQAQIAPDDQDANTSTRSQAVAIAQSDSEDGTSAEIRAPMLAPEEVDAGELEIIEPRVADRRWRQRPAPVAKSELAGADVQNEQSLVINSVAALSAVPTVAAPPEVLKPRLSDDDLTEQWPLYGLVASLVLGAVFLFWRLGERARVSDYELIGYTASSPDDEADITLSSGTKSAAVGDQPKPSTYESLQDALQAMKAARGDES